MYVAVSVAIFIVGLTLHELAHALYMRKAGLKVHQFSFGFGPVLLSKQLKRWDVNIALRILPLGASVQPFEDEETGEPSYQHHCQIMSAGVLTNLLVAAALTVTFCVVGSSYFVIGPAIRVALLVAVLLAVALGVRFFRPITSRYLGYVILPLYGYAIISMVYTGWLFIPYTRLVGRDWGEVFLIAAILQVQLCLMNLIPVFGLDGDQLSRRWGPHVLGEKRWQMLRRSTPLYAFVIAMILAAFFGG